MSAVPLAVLLLGYGDMSFNPSVTAGGASAHPLYLGGMIADAIYWGAILDMAGLLAIPPLLLAAGSFWHKCERKWPAIVALLVNGLVLAMWGQMFFLDI